MRKSFILKIFSASYMQRWNDKLRPIDMIEMDKQAHKMFIAYILGKFQEKDDELAWKDIIEGGIFELLQRIVLTDIKPQVFNEIKKDKDKYRRLNEFVVKEMKPYLSSYDSEFYDRFENFLMSDNDNLTKHILNASHHLSTKWEFDIIKKYNDMDYEIPNIEKDLERRIAAYSDLDGVKEINNNDDYRRFIYLIGELRFQYRWAQLYRVPKTSVLGHSLFVAILSYFFSLEVESCDKRLYNNFYNGLFHDIPEMLTRDIISPIKSSISGLDDLIKDVEKKLMEENFYKLVPNNFINEIRFFTENEFKNIVNGVDYEPTSIEINQNYNEDKFNPKDGRIVRYADWLAAYVEAYSAIKNGCTSNQFFEAKVNIEKKLKDDNKFSVPSIDIDGICKDFEE